MEFGWGPERIERLTLRQVLHYVTHTGDAGSTKSVDLGTGRAMAARYEQTRAKEIASKLKAVGYGI